MSGMHKKCASVLQQQGTQQGHVAHKFCIESGHKMTFTIALAPLVITICVKHL